MNGCNLESLLALSSVLSAAEFNGRNRDRLFPLLNKERTRMFSDAILASSARSYKNRRLSQGDFRYVLNALDAALYDPRIERDIPNHAERGRQLYGVTKVIARMANLQIRQQELHRRMHSGRAVGMFEILPQQYLSHFPEPLRAVVANFVPQIRRKLGTTVLDLARVNRIASLWYDRLDEQVWRLVQDNGGLSSSAFYVSPSHRRAMVLQAVRVAAEQVEDATWFTAQSLHDAVQGRLPHEVIDAYLCLASRSVRQLRETGFEPAYRIGPDGWRLSPLERFPIVVGETKTSDGSLRYMIPNVRTHLRAFPELVHFTLQDSLGDQYNRMRGVMQEVYLRRMLEEQLPSLVVIPELEYSRGRNTVRGPDLTVVDRTDGSLILVESKARRTKAETRFTMDEAVFDENFKDVYDALLKLPTKIEEIRSGAGAYAEFVDDVRAARQGPICVCVVGEAVYFINDLVRHRAAREHSHPLYGFRYPFCIMSLDTFEFAVAIAKQDKVSLGSVLRDYWAASEIRDLSAARADNFGGRDLRALSCFGETFVP